MNLTDLKIIESSSLLSGSSIIQSKSKIETLIIKEVTQQKIPSKLYSTREPAIVPHCVVTVMEFVRIADRIQYLYVQMTFFFGVT